VKNRTAKAPMLWPIVITLGLSAGLLAGCASERAQLRNAVDAYTTTLQVLTDARQAGLIDDATAAEIEGWRGIAREALDAWRLADETAAPAGEPVQRFNEAMRVLTQAVIEAERRRQRADE